MMTKTMLISVRVPKETARRLGALAEATDRSKSYVAAQAIEEFISLQEWQVKAIQRGIDDAEAGRLVDHSVASKRLARWKRRRGA